MGGCTGSVFLFFVTLFLADGPVVLVGMRDVGSKQNTAKVELTFSHKSGSRDPVDD